MSDIYYLHIGSGPECIGLSLSRGPNCNYSGTFLFCRLCILKNLSAPASTGLSRCTFHSWTTGMMTSMFLFEFRNSRMIVFQIVLMSIHPVLHRHPIDYYSGMFLFRNSRILEFDLGGTSLHLYMSPNRMKRYKFV